MERSPFGSDAMEAMEMEACGFLEERPGGADGCSRDGGGRRRTPW
jgi:hypothetical protein